MKIYSHEKCGVNNIAVRYLIKNQNPDRFRRGFGFYRLKAATPRHIKLRSNFIIGS